MSQNVASQEKVDAKKQVLGFADALLLLQMVDEVFVAKGKKVLHFHLAKDKPDEATLRAALLGPTGNLRAPALRKGRTLMVGFDTETYEKLFG